MATDRSNRLVRCFRRRVNSNPADGELRHVSKHVEVGIVRVTIKNALDGLTVEQGCEFFQRAPINITLEGNDFSRWMPVIDPLPGVELWTRTSIQTHFTLLPHELEQIPDLLLSNTHRFTASTNESFR